MFFPEVPVTKIRVSAPAPYKNPTVIRASAAPNRKSGQSAHAELAHGVFSSMGTIFSVRPKCSHRWQQLSEGIPCEPFFPLQHSKTPRTPNLSKICPGDCLWRFEFGGLELVKIYRNLSENYRFSNLTNFYKFQSP